MDPNDLNGIGVELRPKGWLRYFGAAFLTVWLCGWLIGEVLAIGVLLICLGQTFVPEALSRWVPARIAPGGGASLAFGLFIGVWLTFWTFGGIAAIGQWLRTLGGFDRLAIEAGDLTWASGFGPFTWKRKRWPRDQVRGIRTGGRYDPLVLDTDKGLVTLTMLGTPEERRTLRDHLRRALGLASAEAAMARDAEHVPSGWVWQQDLAGGAALTNDPKIRASQARTLIIVAAVVGAGLIAWAVRSATAGLSIRTVIGFLVLSLVESAFVLAALQMMKGGTFLRPHAGALEIERRMLGRPSVTRMEPVTLSVERSTDSDGDAYFRLIAFGPDGKQTLASALHDPRQPLHLGRWLASRLNTELRVPPDLEAA